MIRRHRILLLIVACVYGLMAGAVLAQNMPIIVSAPSDQTICEGADVSFTVLVDFQGDPNPDIRWSFDDESGGGFASLVSGGRVTVTTDTAANPATSTLQITSTDRMIDAGVYRCIATSGGPGAFVDMRLSFQPAPAVAPAVVFNGTFDGLCFGDSIGLDAHQTGSDLPGDLVFWSIDSGPNQSGIQFFPNGDPNPTFTPLASGTYVVRAAFFDCIPSAVAEDTLTVGVFAPLTANPTPANSTTCVSTPTPLAANPSGGDGNYAFLWSVSPADGSFFEPDATAENPMFRPVVSGRTYTVSVTVSAPGAGVVCAAADPASAIVESLAGVVVNATADATEMCFGGSMGVGVDTMPSGSFTYAWSIAAGPDLDAAQFSDASIAAPIFTPSTASPDEPYRLQVRVSGGSCDDGIDTIDITVAPPAATAPSATPSIVCVGGGTQMAANPSGSSTQGFIWSVVSGPDTSSDQLSNPTAENPLFTPSAIGLYQLQLQLFDDFCNNPADQTIDVEARAVLSAAPMPTDAVVCPGTAVSLSANPDGGGGMYTFAWSVLTAPPGGLSDTFSDPTAENPTFTPTMVGTYELEVVVDADGCHPADPVMITVEVVGQLDVTATTQNPSVCLPGFAVVTVVTGGGAADVTWSILAGSPDTDPNQFQDPNALQTLFRPSTTGEYTLQVDVGLTGGECGVSRDTLVIDAFDPPLADATADQDVLCLGDHALLQVATGGSGVPNQTITWTISSGPDTVDSSQLQNADSDTATFTPNASTTPGNPYILNVNVLDPACVSSTDGEVIITVNAALDAAPSSDPVVACQGIPVELSANAVGADGNYTYTWSIVAGPANPPSVFDDATLEQPTFTPMVGPADYTLQLLVDNDMCESLSPAYFLTLPVEAPLSVAPIAEFDPGVLGLSMSLHANAIGGTNPAFTWSVAQLPTDCDSDSPLTNADTPDPTFTPGCVGTYTLTLVASDPVCTDVQAGITLDVITFSAAPSADPPALCETGATQSAVLSANLNDGGNFGTFSFLWTILPGSPDTSPTQFPNGPTGEHPTFAPTAPGVYTIEVVADDNDGQLPDITAQMSIEVSTDAPSITAASGDETVCAGEAATFTVTASGTDLSLQWMFNGVVIPDETSSILAIQPVVFNDAGTYTCVVSNGCGQVASQPAVLTVDPPLAETLLVGVREDTILRNADAVGCRLTGNLSDRGDMGIDHQGTPFDQVMGLARDPLSDTFYGAVRIDADPPETFLVTVDPVGGAAVVVASMGQPIADLAFHPDGTLYAIRGNHDCLACPGQQGLPGEIFTVNLADATLTALTPSLDFGMAAGHAITFDQQGLLYHHAKDQINGTSQLTRTNLSTRVQETLRDFDTEVSLTAMTIHDNLFIVAHRAAPNELWSLDKDNGYQETVLGPIVTSVPENRSVMALVFGCITSGDSDCDGDIDLNDFAAFQTCATTPPPATPACSIFDADGDADVDLTDWGAFQTHFTGTP